MKLKIWKINMKNYSRRNNNLKFNIKMKITKNYSKKNLWALPLFNSIEKYVI